MGHKKFIESNWVKISICQEKIKYIAENTKKIYKI